MGEWSSDLKKFLFTFPLKEDAISELLKRVSVPLVFVLVFHFLGWVEAILFLLIFILLYNIEERNMFNLFQNLPNPNLVRNNSTYSNRNPVLGSQNQDFYQVSRWSMVRDETFQESIGIERIPPYPYKVIVYTTGIAQEEIQKLKKEILQELEEKLLEEKPKRIPINFLDSEKLKLKRSFDVNLEYSSKDNIYIVDCPELNLYGEGRDEISAIEDFKIALEESYFSLKKDKDRLSPHLEKEWKFLTDILEEK